MRKSSRLAALGLAGLVATASLNSGCMALVAASILSKRGAGGMHSRDYNEQLHQESRNPAFACNRWVDVNGNGIKDAGPPEREFPGIKRIFASGEQVTFAMGVLSFKGQPFQFDLSRIGQDSHTILADYSGTVGKDAAYVSYAFPGFPEGVYEGDWYVNDHQVKVGTTRIKVIDLAP